MSGLFQTREVFAPQALVIDRQMVQPFPRIKAGVMTIVKAKANGIRPHRLYRGDVDMLLAELKHFLSRTMAAHFGRWRINTQVFARQPVMPAVVEGDLDDSRLLMQLDFSRPDDGLGHNRSRR